MRLTRYLYEGDAIKKALEIEEPEVGKKYSKKEVKWRISNIEDAISVQKKEGVESESDNALMKDLLDKLKKWKNIKSETKPAGPVIPAVDVLASTVAPEPPEPPGEGDKKKDKKK